MRDLHSAKAACRARLRAARATLPPDQRRIETEATNAALRVWLDRHRPSAVAAYLAVRNELDLADVIDGEWSAGRAVLLPRIDGSNLIWYPVRDRSELHLGSMHITEPDPAVVHSHRPPPGTVALVPGLGFGKDGTRLGQGGGYFDRWLSTVTGIITIGIGFSCQRDDELPVEDHDHPCQGVVLGGEWVRPLFSA